METNAILTKEQEQILVQNLNKNGLQYLVENFKLQTIVPESEYITYFFEGGLQLRSEACSASGQEVLTTELLNSKGERLTIF